MPRLPVVYAALVLVAAGWLAAVPFLLASSPRTEWRESPPAPLPASATLDELERRLGGPAATRIPGSALNPQLQGSCDIWERDRLAVFVCHPDEGEEVTS